MHNNCGAMTRVPKYRERHCSLKYSLPFSHFKTAPWSGFVLNIIRHATSKAPELFDQCATRKKIKDYPHKYLARYSCSFVLTQSNALLLCNDMLVLVSLVAAIQTECDWTFFNMKFVVLTGQPTTLHTDKCTNRITRLCTSVALDGPN